MTLSVLRQWLWLLRPLPLLLLSSLLLPLPLPPVAATVVAAGVAVTAVADVAAPLLLAQACTSCVNSTPAKLSLFSSLSGGPAASMTTPTTGPDPSAGPGHQLRDRQVELLLELVAVRAAPSTMPNRRLSALVDRIFDETQESQQHIRFCQALDTLVHVVFEMSRSEAADGQLPADHPRARSRSRSPRDNG